jgi:hypothetical protein
VTPFVSDADFTLYVGDVREVLAGLPAESVHCVVTSPPYWGLRDYQTGSWEGGNTDCDHIAGRGGHLKDWSGNTRGGANKVAEAQTTPMKDVCGKCGARRVDQQLGLESTPDCGKRGLFRLRSDLTAEQREFVARRLAGVESPDA